MIEGFFKVCTQVFMGFFCCITFHFKVKRKREYKKKQNSKAINWSLFSHRNIGVFLFNTRYDDDLVDICGFR